LVNLEADLSVEYYFSASRMNIRLDIGDQELRAGHRLRALREADSFDFSSSQPFTGLWTLGCRRQGVLDSSLRFDRAKNKQKV
jgi:hypothetical protein